MKVSLNLTEEGMEWGEGGWGIKIIIAPMRTQKCFT